MSRGVYSLAGLAALAGRYLLSARSDLMPQNLPLARVKLVILSCLAAVLMACGSLGAADDPRQLVVVAGATGAAGAAGAA